MPTHRVLVNHLCAGLIPERQLRITDVWIDQYAIRIEYLITPPLANVRPPPFHWLWFAVDNHGKQYTEAGGAYGLAQDGKSTEGVLSLVPLPSAEVQFLRVTLAVVWFHTVGDAGKCTFDVDLTAASGES